MFKNILFINFIASSVLGLGIYIAQQLEVNLPTLLNNYVNDFLIIPIVLSVCMYVLRYTRNDKSFTIPIPEILLLCIVYSVFFEVVLPKTHQRYTADIVDVLLYFLGGIWFYILQHKSFGK